MPYAGLSKKAVKPAVVGVSILACFFILYGIMEQRKQSLTYFVGKSQRQATRERPSNSNAVAHEGTNGGGNNQEMDDSEEWENSIERVHYSSNDDDISRHDLLDGGNRLRPQAHSGHETHGNATKKGAHQRRQQAAGLLLKRPPDFIVIGVRKCGTRALLNMIGLHPQTVSAGPEIHFFDKKESYKNGLKWYINRMKPSTSSQLTGEKTPAYFIQPDVPQRMSKYFKTVHKKPKLLLVVREPVSRIVSDFTQGLYNDDNVDIQELNKKDIQAQFRNKALGKDGQINRKWRAITVSEYSVHLRRWWEVFHRDELLIINGDNLITNPAKEMTKVSSFLNLDKSVDWSRVLYYNETRGFYCYDKDGESTCLSSSKGRTHPEVEESVLAKLRKYYKPFNSQFVKMTGLDVDWDMR